MMRLMKMSLALVLAAMTSACGPAFNFEGASSLPAGVSTEVVQESNSNPVESGSNKPRDSERDSPWQDFPARERFIRQCSFLG